jgi:hypothetical protein
VKKPCTRERESHTFSCQLHGRFGGPKLSQIHNQAFLPLDKEKETKEPLDIIFGPKKNTLWIKSLSFYKTAEATCDDFIN